MSSLDEARINEALVIYRQLAKRNPDAHLHGLIHTLNKWGVLLRKQSRFDEAREAFDEALAISRQLAKKEPDVYLPDVALTLCNLGMLLRDQKLPDEARQALVEAIEIIKPFAIKSPDKFQGNADFFTQQLLQLDKDYPWTEKF